MDPYKNKYLKYKQKYLKKKLALKNAGIDTTLYNNANLYGGNTNPPTLYLFKADWCGHCVAFKDKWNELNNDKLLNNKIKFVEYDADKNTTEITAHNIQGFPTLLLNVNNKKIEYNGKRELSEIKSFINNHI